MIKYYCDRCGKEYYNVIKTYIPYDYKENEDKLSMCGIEVKKYDLCADCFEELKNWVKKYE